MDHPRPPSTQVQPRQYVIRNHITGASVLSSFFCILFAGFFIFWLLRITYYSNLYNSPANYTAWYLWVWIILLVFACFFLSLLTERVYVYRRLSREDERDLEEPFYEDDPIHDTNESRGTYVDLRQERRFGGKTYTQVPTEEKSERKQEQSTTRAQQ
jgi:hypothetical protein